MGPPEAAAPAGPRARLVEPLVTFLLATGVASALFWLSTGFPLLASNLHGAIAVIFLFAPMVAARLSGRPFDYHEAGLHLSPLRLNAAVLGLAIAITWPVFLGAFLAFYGGVCRLHDSSALGYWVDWVATNCARWGGPGQAHLVWRSDFLLVALTQLVVVAVPEELFFRGYLLSRLEQRWPPGRRLLGAPVGLALLLSSALFALGHVLVDFNPQRLAVFFPGLVFAWMRARTGSLAPAALFHALCNLYSDLLHEAFFR
jgi:membrane protease YdiL (CAAX protease family)